MYDPTNNETFPFDLQALIAGCVGNLVLVAAILNEFEHEVISIKERILVSGRRGDIKEMTSAAHKLKGSAQMFSARGIQNISADIEERGRAGHLDNIGPVLTRLCEEVQECLDYIPSAKERLAELSKQTV